jgi:hypothetical protein
MPAKTRRTKKTKRTKKNNKKNRYGGAPAISSKKSSAKSSEKREKLMELIKEKYKKVGNLEVTDSTIKVYEYVLKHPELLKTRRTRGLLMALLDEDSEAVEEQINANEEQLANDYVNTRKILEGLIAEANRNA